MKASQPGRRIERRARAGRKSRSYSVYEEWKLSCSGVRRSGSYVKDITRELREGRERREVNRVTLGLRPIKREI